VVRLWVASQDFRNDIVVSEERVNKVSETYRGIRNALRYQLSNLTTSIRRSTPCPMTNSPASTAGFSRVLKVRSRSHRGLRQIRISRRLSKDQPVHCCELSSIYHDVIKDRLYTDPANSQRRRSTQTVLHRLVTGLLPDAFPDSGVHG